MTSNHWLILKAVSWQLLGLVSMSLIGFFISGNWQTGGLLAAISAVVSFFTFLIHEKIWGLLLVKQEDQRP